MFDARYDTYAISLLADEASQCGEHSLQARGRSS